MKVFIDTANIGEIREAALVRHSFEGLRAAKCLSQERIKTNVTLRFSATQAILVAKAGPRT